MTFTKIVKKSARYWQQFSSDYFHHDDQISWANISLCNNWYTLECLKSIIQLLVYKSSGKNIIAQHITLTTVVKWWRLFLN